MRPRRKASAALADREALAAWYRDHADHLASAGIAATFSSSFPIDGTPEAAWVSFTVARLLGRAVVWAPGRFETTVAHRRDGLVYRRESRTAASADDLANALGRQVDHLRRDDDPGPWWDAPPRPPAQPGAPR